MKIKSNNVSHNIITDNSENLGTVSTTIAQTNVANSDLIQIIEKLDEVLANHNPNDDVLSGMLSAAKDSSGDTQRSWLKKIRTHVEDVASLLEKGNEILQYTPQITAALLQALTLANVL